MNPRDVMTTAVVSVNPDTPIRRVAELLLEYGISAVPVVDNIGAAIGIVSEGDLVGRKITEHDKRRNWGSHQSENQLMPSIAAPERLSRRERQGRRGRPTVAGRYTPKG